MDIGDIKIVDGIKTWRKSCSNYLLLIPCKKCDKERWVNKNTLKRPNYEGQCKKCSGNHAKPPRYTGRYFDSEGYIMVQLRPDNPFYSMAESNGYVKEHRLVMAQALGRCLLPSEIPHHKNGIVSDNRLVNLEIKNPSSHMAEHDRLRYAGNKGRNIGIRKYHSAHPEISLHKLAKIFGMAYSNIHHIINT